MNKLKSIILAAAAFFVGTSCNGQKSKIQSNMNKSIVIYFSHAGDNYSVGNIEVGNTKIVADYISEIHPIRHPYEKGVQARRGIEY